MRLCCDYVGHGVGSLGLLVLRAVTGAAFMFHGWDKIQQPMDWMGPKADMPGFLQAAAALSEFGGGMFLIIGFLTPLAALMIAGTMSVALVTVHLKHGDPFVDPKGPSYESAAVYLAIMIMLLFVGPGLLSVDALLFRAIRGIFRKEQAAPPAPTWKPGEFGPERTTKQGQAD